MARTRGQQSNSNADEPSTSDAANVQTYLQQLAYVLNKSTTRSLKAKQVATALQKSVDTLPDGSLKSALQHNLNNHAAVLHKLLSASAAAKETPVLAADDKPAKRTKRASSSRRDSSTKQQQEEASLTLVDDTLNALIQQATETGTLEGSIHLLAPLLARVPAPDGYIDYLVDQAVEKSASKGASVADKELKASRLAVQICNAVAGQCRNEIDALATYLPAILQLESTLQTLVAEESNLELLEEPLQELMEITDKLLFCMTTVRVEVQLAAERGAGDNSDWILQWNTTTAANSGLNSGVVAAEKACFGLVSLQIAVQYFLHSDTAQKSISRETEAAIIKSTTAVMNELGPFATIGCLLQLSTWSNTDGKNNNKDDEGPDFSSLPHSNECALLSFLAASEQRITSVDHYMLYLLASQKASSLATFLNKHTVAAQILDKASNIPALSSVISWLQQQPPSAIILAAIAALEQGPQGLSAHLVYDASEGALKALSVAARAGEVAAVVGNPQFGLPSGEQGDGAEGEADELLFFVSKEGDKNAFEGGEYDSDDDERPVGLRMEDLPDVGKETRVDDDYLSEDEEDE